MKRKCLSCLSNSWKVFFQRKFLVMKLRRKSVWLSMNIGWPMKGDNMNHISWHRRFFLVNGPYLR